MNKITVEIDAEKLNAIRRKLSFQNNLDLTNQETLDLIIDSYSKNAVPKERRPVYNSGQQEVRKLIQNGSTSREALRTLGCSRSTFFRIKAKERRKAEQA